MIQGEDIADVIVVGAGAVGLSTAYQLIQARPTLKVVVLEKEARPAFHQTGNNSGVIHSGIYYKPGSLKAQLCCEGREELVSFCQEHEVAHDVCGKIIVATEERELDGLQKIYQTGLANGLAKIEMIDGKGVSAIEPHCNGIAGIFVPYTGIVDYVGVCQKLQQLIDAKAPRHRVVYQAAVQQIQVRNDVYELQTQAGLIKGKYLLTCGGLYSDQLARMEGLQPNCRIVPFRGDYYDLTPAARHKVKNLIYPVPNPAFPFLGVHFTRMVDGTIECGPSAVFSFKREGYAKTDFSWKDTIDALTFKGTWKLFFKHWRFGINEYQQAFSKGIYLKKLQKLVPSLTIEDLVPGRSGVRAMALNPDGTMVDDFLYVHHHRSIHVLNAPSPAATACLAIGRVVSGEAIRHFNL
jgi:(S)-2-hydroxyglutarate dehydrogenase